MKGGNAIAFTGVEPVRRSIDLDFSIDGDLEDLGALVDVQARIEALLVEVFSREGLTVFDVRLEKQPPRLRDDVLGDFWGGYLLEFKVLPTGVFDGLDGQNDRRRQAVVVGPSGRRSFSVDISRHEYCRDKQLRLVEGFPVFVYSEQMIVCEKVRAICQQMPEYREIVKSNSARPRARDFFDIHHIASQLQIDFAHPEFEGILARMFKVKRVPFRLVGDISAHREFHRDDFESVRATVAVGDVRDFDFYVDYLVKELAPLHARWVVEPPSI